MTKQIITQYHAAEQSAGIVEDCILAVQSESYDAYVLNGGLLQSCERFQAVRGLILGACELVAMKN